MGFLGVLGAFFAGRFFPFIAYGVRGHAMGSKVIQWGQRSLNGVRGHPMGSKVTLWGQRSSYGGSKVNPMGSMESEIILWEL